jgi:hypothetical protein
MVTHEAVTRWPNTFEAVRPLRASDLSVDREFSTK